MFSEDANTSVATMEQSNWGGAFYYPGNRHNGGQNCVCVDGHAKWVKPDDSILANYWGVAPGYYVYPYQ